MMKVDVCFKNVSITEGCLIDITEEKKNIILGRVVDYELSIPRMIEIAKRMKAEQRAAYQEVLMQQYLENF